MKKKGNKSKGNMEYAAITACNLIPMKTTVKEPLLGITPGKKWMIIQKSKQKRQYNKKNALTEGGKLGKSLDLFSAGRNLNKDLSEITHCPNYLVKKPARI